MSRVECRVFDAAGRVVATLFSGQQDKGSYRLAWNRTNDNARRVNHGVYFVRVAAQGLQVQTKLVVL